MQGIQQFISTVAANFWNPVSIAILLGTGFLLTFVTKGIQIRKFTFAFGLMLKGAFHKDDSDKEKGDISPFQALMTALSSTVGNGNIAGVATAIASGGPGAVFWMWVTAIVGMATKYAEAVLAVKYRTTSADGSFSGGPMYYIRYGFEQIPWLKSVGVPLAAAFAFFGTWTALFGTGNMMQSNSMALANNTQFGIPFWVTGVVIAALTAAVIIGGIKRIGKVAEFLVPGMITVYMLSAIYILLSNISQIPAGLSFIVQSAFSPQAAVGGFVGHTVRQALQFGVRRGLLSNESGLGSAPIAHGASKAKNPVRQGLIAMLGTFIDTLVVCTMTALVIILTGAYQVSDGAGGTLTSTALTAQAFGSTIPFGGSIVALSSMLFGYSTLIGWYYYGERCFDYLFGIKKIRFYKVAYVSMTLLGSILQGDNLQIVWDIGDLSNGLMALPNLLGLIFLSGVVMKITNEYIRENKI